MNSSDAMTFEIDRQSGENISNVGGDQMIYYGDRGRASRIGTALAALGLCLSLVGVALMVIMGVMTVHNVVHAAHTGAVHTPYTRYVPSAWPAAVGLLLSGFVVNRVARILAGR